MKADTSYNDFTGTVSADISDHTNLTELAERFKINIERYEVLGMTAFFSYEDSFSCSIVLNDKSKAPNAELCQVMLDIDLKDFLSYFKRLHMVFLDKHSPYRSEKAKEYLLEDFLSDRNG